LSCCNSLTCAAPIMALKHQCRQCLAHAVSLQSAPEMPTKLGRAVIARWQTTSQAEQQGRGAAPSTLKSMTTNSTDISNCCILQLLAGGSTAFLHGVQHWLH
jgi:hypothetical protein